MNIKDWKKFSDLVDSCNKKRITRNEAYDLAYKHKHDFDTVRRILDPSKTYYSKIVKKGNRIKYWDYISKESFERLKNSHTSHTDTLKDPEPLYITKQREEAENSQNSLFNN